MGQLNPDTLISVAVGDLGRDDRRLIERLLSEAKGIDAYKLSQDGVLTVSFADEQDEFALVRLLAAVGVVPTLHNLTDSSSGGHRAC